MFSQLNTILSDDTPSLTLKLTRGANGTMKVCVMPSTTSKNPALAQPLALAATPAELDEGFADLLTTYETNRQSLNAQVAATTAILGQATKTAADKAVKGLKSKTVQPTAKAEGGTDDDNGDDDVPGDTLDTAAPAATVSAPAAASPDQNDLLSLLD